MVKVFLYPAVKRVVFILLGDVFVNQIFWAVYLLRVLNSSKENCCTLKRFGQNTLDEKFRSIKSFGRQNFSLPIL